MKEKLVKGFCPSVFTTEQTDLMVSVINKMGSVRQENMLFEEMAELQKAILKFRRLVEDTDREVAMQFEGSEKVKDRDSEAFDRFVELFGISPEKGDSTVEDFYWHKIMFEGFHMKEDGSLDLSADSLAAKFIQLKQDIMEELADVLIMTAQAVIMYGNPEKVILAKLERLKDFAAKWEKGKDLGPALLPWESFPQGLDAEFVSNMIFVLRGERVSKGMCGSEFGRVIDFPSTKNS
jgi:hypothetical protein